MNAIRAKGSQNGCADNFEVIYIPGVYHCSEMSRSDPINDPPQITEARLKITNLLSKWLNHKQEL
jgi:hypothetical protein